MSDAAPKSDVRELFFFELECIAVPGRQAMFEAVRDTLKPKDIDVTPVLFSRYGLASRPGPAVQALIDASGKNLTTGDQLATKAEQALDTFFEEKAELNPALPPLIREALDRRIQPVAISALSEKKAAALMARLGLDELGVELEAFDETEPLFPRADHWLRMLKNREQEELPGMAAVSSRTACKGALTAGLACIVVPDDLTAFEDMSGARIVLDRLDDMPPGELLDLVSRP